MKCNSTLFIILFCSTIIFAQTKKPSWIEKRPIIKGFYIGIGSSPRSGSAQENMQRAKDGALNDIAQQIVVTINADQMSKISEKLGDISQEFQSQIRTSTKAELEGVESVDSWEGEDEYWTYFRLSIELYERLRAEKIKKAISLSFDLFTKAKTSETSGNLGQALQFYLQSLSAIEKHLTEQLEVSYNGKKIFLGNELFSSIQTVLNQVEIKSKTSKVEAQIGIQVKQPLEVILTNSENSKPIINIPVKFSFLRGAGDLIGSSRTNSNGIASTQIAKVTATDKLQMVKAEIDLVSPVGQSANSPVFETLLKSFTVPSTRIIVNVVNLSVFFEVEESILGTPMKLPRTEPLLKNSLSSQGYAFVDDVAKATMMITIKANGRDGGEYNGLYTVYVDANISVTDLNSGQEIYKTSVTNIKGISINYDKAGTKAYDEISERMKSEVIPAILEKLRK